MAAGEKIKRRDFLKLPVAAALPGWAGEALAASGGAAPGAATGPVNGAAIVVPPDDPIATSAPCQHAVEALVESLQSHRVPVHRLTQISQVPRGSACLVIAGADSALARGHLKQSGVRLPQQPEAFVLAPARQRAQAFLLACARDPRGLAYAVLEVADRIQYATDPLASLTIRKPEAEAPANAVRGINRCFVSDVEDKPWFNDRALWPRYFSMLAAQRFNRFSLTLGLGYDFPRGLRDVYFYFAYPFLVRVPGYDVTAVPLPAAERDRNLQTLRAISDLAVAHGLEFHLGLWTHAYQWQDSPDANYTIQGLTPQTHAPYCRDALATVLAACPSISGITLRIHGESGIPEGSYDFWKTVFDGAVKAGRRLELNLHAKGIDQKMIDLALTTGLPVTVSPKFWAEHMGLAYQQASIRELEMPHAAHQPKGYFTLSSGSRSFTRYGYADLLREDRRYGIIYRIWPGSRRVLLWGSADFAAGYGRSSSFCGSQGVDLLEPLSFKGRHGSGLPGGRCAYADRSLQPPYDWMKFLYTYRVWGRLVYNPGADPESWRRTLRREFAGAAPAMENALAHASRILPLVTTAHAPSAANNSYWPEIYTNMPLVDAARNHIYGDTPAPKILGNVSSFDPILFSSVNECAEELVKGQASGKYSPLDVANWLEDLAAQSLQYLMSAQAQAADSASPGLRRAADDINIQCGIGRFFAWKLRSGVLYGIYQQTGEREALQKALEFTRKAIAAWAEMAHAASRPYRRDITYGYDDHQRRDWLFRVAGMEDDAADLEKLLAAPQEPNQTGKAEQARAAIERVVARPAPPNVLCRHNPPARFDRGRDLPLALSVGAGAGEGAAQPLAPNGPINVQLRYRHVNQSEHYQTAPMQREAGDYRAIIPAAYTQTEYPLQYFFVLSTDARTAWSFPGLGPSLSNQPYFVVRSKA
jgi:hypothetical protein